MNTIPFNNINVIDDIPFELFTMHCGIGLGIRQKKIPQEKLLYRKYNKLIISLESPHRPECICFFLNAISSIRKPKFSSVIFKFPEFKIKNYKLGPYFYPRGVFSVQPSPAGYYSDSI